MVGCSYITLTIQQACESSAETLKLAEVELTRAISEISVNLMRKFFMGVGRGYDADFV